ncbi:MAG: hypothetical protein WC365_04330 [Candidatus Babeliales bacterium]|jgi:hypothetical protein
MTQEPRFKIVRNVDSRNPMRTIKQNLPENAEVVNVIPQLNMPKSVAVIYNLPKQKNVRKPSNVAKPHSPRKPHIKGFED